MARLRHAQPAALVAAILLTTVAGASAQSVPPAPGADDVRDTNVLAYVELLRSDLRSEVSAVITEVMQFTEAEDAAFWPVYRAFEVDLAKINDERMALVAEYASSYDTLTDEAADRIARKALEVEGRRQALKAQYYDRFKAVLPGKTAARFLQVENQILLLLDLQVASSLPIVSR
jgi:hypothetical protein